MHAKGFTAVRSFIVGSFVALVIGTFTACGVDYEWGPDVPAYPCADPTYSDYHSIRCVRARCKDGKGIPEDHCPDAGSSEDGGSSARCPGPCVPNAPNGFDDPQPVYFGPNNGKYAAGCPVELGSFGGVQYSGLNVISFGCPACTCGALEGSCAPPPAISVRAGLCDDPQATSTDFSGPANWDGSCTNTKAIAAGAECPPGSGVLCVQSIEASTMPAPTEACLPIPIPVPKFGSEVPWRSEIVLSCSANAAPQKCENATADKCMPALPVDDPNWKYCVRSMMPGKQLCPGPGSTYTKQKLGYADYVDTRSCTECTCEPTGSACYGTLRLYNDDTCSTNELTATTLSSNLNSCDNLQPAGESLGSKEFTDLLYVPGTCVPSGGETFGTAEPDDATVVTWCCQADAT